MEQSVHLPQGDCCIFARCWGSGGFFFFNPLSMMMHFMLFSCIKLGDSSHPSLPAVAVKSSQSHPRAAAKARVTPCPLEATLVALLCLLSPGSTECPAALGPSGSTQAPAVPVLLRLPGPAQSSLWPQPQLDLSGKSRRWQGINLPRVLLGVKGHQGASHPWMPPGHGWGYECINLRERAGPGTGCPEHLWLFLHP